MCVNVTQLFQYVSVCVCSLSAITGLIHYGQLSEHFQLSSQNDITYLQFPGKTNCYANEL